MKDLAQKALTSFRKELKDVAPLAYEEDNRNERESV